MWQGIAHSMMQLFGQPLRVAEIAQFPVPFQVSELVLSPLREHINDRQGKRRFHHPGQLFGELIINIHINTPTSEETPDPARQYTTAHANFKSFRHETERRAFTNQ